MPETEEDPGAPFEPDPSRRRRARSPLSDGGPGPYRVPPPAGRGAPASGGRVIVRLAWTDGRLSRRVLATPVAAQDFAAPRSADRSVLRWTFEQPIGIRSDVKAATTCG
ncbi:hypothetical protein GCM10010151_37970 [Actinoallomurus spadix]|uniref:Uncharacterized protein n=1 Tax=Actinoallomurus spadix TaxID=79912 RepID=A0ABN0WRP2_9ACTN